jgi:hypothetical protein
MFWRLSTIALNTYREAVRARILLGMLGLALATLLYSIVIAAMSLHQEIRVLADVGAASTSLYSVLVSVLLGATSLHRELELKTVFPILTRELRRHEYLLGKYLGTLLVLAVFVALNGGGVLLLLAVHSDRPLSVVGGSIAAMLAVLAVLFLRARQARVFVLAPWSFAFFTVAWYVARPAGPDVQLLTASCALAMFEVAIVAAIAVLFSSFSSPFLTATFTLGVFIVGRSADTLAHLPVRVIGPGLSRAGGVLATIVPNLHTYVPPRPLLLGEVAAVSLPGYIGRAGLNALLYVTILLVVSCLVFRRRDFL